MAAALLDAAAGVLEGLRRLVHIPLDQYFHYLPQMPNGERPADLVKAGFPHAGDLVDGLLLIVFLTALRVVITPLLLDGLGRAAMRHRYYRTPAQPQLDAVLKCVSPRLMCIVLERGETVR